MKWVVHVACVAEKRNTYIYIYIYIRVYGSSWLGNMKERTEVGRTCNRREDNVKRILEKYDVRARTKIMLLRIRKISFCYFHGNEHSGSLKCGEILNG